MNKDTKMFIFILIVGLITCSNSFSAAMEDNQNQKFQGFNLQGYTKEGAKAWDVNGDSANVNGTQVDLENIVANVYGDQKMNVTAKTGSMNQVSGHMHLKEDVVITSERGTRLLTDSLDWYRNDDLVTTDDDVLITDQGLTATGKGMKANPGLKLAQLKKDVTVRVDTTPKDKNPQTVTITCDGPMMMDQAQSKAILKDNVEAMQGDRILKADYMEVYFDKTTSQVSNLVCIGNVEIQQGENKSYAEKAVYDAKTQTITLSGRPKLIMQTEGTNVLTAPGNK